MPRHARVVFPGLPHHVTQRGNHRQRVFFTRGDHLFYLDQLEEQVRLGLIEAVAYCLMPNHVHLVLVPSSATALHQALKIVHGRHAQRINRMKCRTGHLWQGRYFSAPLGGEYFSNAVRYVELNPVRAGIVEPAEVYPWSSAAAHCGLRRDSIVDRMERPRQLAGIDDWSRWLAAGVPKELLDTLRRHTSQNVPCGPDEFVTRLEEVSGRDLRYCPRGVNAAYRDGRSTEKRGDAPDSEASPGDIRHRK
jgi:putative transposase